MMPTTRDKVRAVLLICDAVLETVKEAGEHGAPASALYLAFQSHNIGFATFTSLMDLLEKAGRVRLSNHVYYYKEKANG